MATIFDDIIDLFAYVPEDVIIAMLLFLSRDEVALFLLTSPRFYGLRTHPAVLPLLVSFDDGIVRWHKLSVSKQFRIAHTVKESAKRHPNTKTHMVMLDFFMNPTSILDDQGFGLSENIMSETVLFFTKNETWRYRVACASFKPDKDDLDMLDSVLPLLNAKKKMILDRKPAQY